MKALLVLEDGFTLTGASFTGAIDGETIGQGEVIFNTAMTGYQEVLTDPSYCGQMVCMTYPMVGNYGINAEDNESDRVHVSALLVKECCKEPSNWRSIKSLPDYLVENNVPGVENLDTRALTRHLRINGAMRGVISTTCLDPKELQKRAQAMPSMEGQNLVTRVAPTSTYTWSGSKPEPVSLANDGAHTWKGTGTRLVVYDYGIKWNILRLLEAQGFDMLMVPPHFTPEDVKNCGAQAVFLSNGPGDPAILTKEINIVRELIKIYPVAGICLGHQLLGHALGGSTSKLKFGHHGCNHPVKNLRTNTVEISSQNHGFCVDLTGVPDVEMTHINLNDNTLEGFAHTKLPIISIQHHPEAAPGPIDSQCIFGHFKKVINDSIKA